MQIARNETMVDWGFLDGKKYLIHDRDTKYGDTFIRIIKDVGVKPVTLPARSPNLNAYAERWVLSVKSECLSKLIFFGEASLRRAILQYIAHYHQERPHQGKENRLLFPGNKTVAKASAVRCKKRPGGLLRFYFRDAA